MIKTTIKTDEKIEFKTDMNVGLLNAIRRSVNSIPILAIDSLEISKNDSALYDEIIAHRMGLIPLTYEDLKLPSECDCGKEDGCAKCSVKFKLVATGPGVVYSDQITPKGTAIYKMPITLLEKDQELELLAIAKMGKGIEHAKFSPGILYYRYEEDLKKESDEDFRKLVEESKKGNKEMEVVIESWGQIKAKDIFIKAVEALNKEIKELDKEIA